MIAAARFSRNKQRHFLSNQKPVYKVYMKKLSDILTVATDKSLIGPSALTSFSNSLNKCVCLLNSVK